MKSLLMLQIAIALFAGSANAAQLICTSKKGEYMYYDYGQIIVTADIKTEAYMENLIMEFKGGNLSSNDPEAAGKQTEKYVRFDMFGDHVCSYKLTLPKGFTGKTSFPGFFDSYCEEDTNQSFTLSCKVR